MEAGVVRDFTSSTPNGNGSSDSHSNRPASRDWDQLILEGIVTTRNRDGTTNISPMGPVVDRTMCWLRIRPFQTSTTYRNLKRDKQGVFHVTDDAQLLVRAAIGQLSELPLMRACPYFDGQIITSACRWYAFEVQSLDDDRERAEIQCTVIGKGHQRDFLGWNRAIHAVLEAAIVATRLQILSAREVKAELERLSVIIDKTASDQERDAFDLVLDFVRSQGPKWGSVVDSRPGP